MAQGKYSDEVNKTFVEGHYNIEGNIGLFTAWQLGSKLPKRKYRRIIKKPLPSSLLKYLNNRFAELVQNIQVRHVLIKIAVDFYYLHKLDYCPCEKKHEIYENYVRYAYATYYGIDNACKRFNTAKENLEPHVNFYNAICQRKINLKLIVAFRWLFNH